MKTHNETTQAEESKRVKRKKKIKCPYCSSTQGRCATTSFGRSITECSSCGRVDEERQTQNHHLFHFCAQDTPLSLVTQDLHTPPQPSPVDEEDPFESTGFITAFSTWSLEPNPIFSRFSLSFSDHLAELEQPWNSLHPQRIRRLWRITLGLKCRSS